MSFSRFSIGLLLLVQACLVSAQESRSISDELEQLRLENKALKLSLDNSLSAQKQLMQEQAILQYERDRAEKDARDLRAERKEFVETLLKRQAKANRQIIEINQRLDLALEEKTQLQIELKQLRSLVEGAEQPIIDSLSSDDESVRRWVHKHLVKLPWPRQSKMKLTSRDLETKPLTRGEQLKRALAAPGENYEFIDTPLSDAVAFWGDLYGIEIVVSKGIDQENCLLTHEIKGEQLRTAMENALKKHDLSIRIAGDVIVIEQMKADELPK